MRNPWPMSRRSRYRMAIVRRIASVVDIVRRRDGFRSRAFEAKFAELRAASLQLWPQSVLVGTCLRGGAYVVVDRFPTGGGCLGQTPYVTPSRAPTAVLRGPLVTRWA